MPAIVTKENNFIENRKLSECPISWSSEYRYNDYLIDDMYTVSFSYKKRISGNMIRYLRYINNKIRGYINFKFDTDKHSWSSVYTHFMKHYNEFKVLNGKNYIHEQFDLDRPTRMFFDLDFKCDIDHKTVDTYIKNLIMRVSKYVKLDLQYIVTCNDNGDSSRHVIITNLILPDIVHCKVLATKFKDIYIDLLPYAGGKSLRAFNGIKVSDSGSEKTKIFLEANYSVPLDETYLIQPYDCNDVVNYRIANFKDPNAYKYEELKDNDALAGIDMSTHGFVIHNRITNTNLYSLHRVEERDCPICGRLHSKTDTNYLIVNNAGVYLRCYRSNGSVSIRSNKFKLFEYLESIKSNDYNYLQNNNSITYNTYNTPNAQMPDLSNPNTGNVVYLVSPCKSSKTKTVHELLSKEEYANKSVCFITMQTKFTRNLSERFKDLGFSCYLDSDFNPNHSKVIISLYSLCRLENIDKYDLVIIDEVESMLVNFVSVGTLGNKDNRKCNLRKYTQLIHNSPMILLMDAYPSQHCIEHFQAFDNKKIDVYMNDYKTHKDDKIIMIEDTNVFVNAMAKALSRGENIVFASALKEQQIEMVNKVFTALKELYNTDPDSLETLIYNGDLDKKKMDESIKDIDSSWYVNFLVYSPCITAGISFEGTNFDRVFYLGYPNSNHISALQAIYRVRDVSNRKYYFTFGRSYPVFSKLYDEDELKHIGEFNPADLPRNDLLDFNMRHSDFSSEIELANTLSNRILDISDKYLIDSQKNYYKHLIGQFKYNGSQIKFKSKEYQENKSRMLDLNKVDEEDVKDLFKSQRPEDFYVNISGSHRSDVNITDEDYTQLLNDTDYNALHNKVNKSMQEEEVLEINTYARMFPKFNKNVHPSIKKAPAKYYRYYRTYTKYGKYVNEKLHTFVDFKMKKTEPININDEPVNRFRIQVVSKFLQRLLVDDTLKYEDLHNAEYTDFQLDEILDALNHVYEDVLKKDKIYLDVFMKEFYSKDMLRAKTPLNTLDTWKKVQGLVNNMIDGTFNLKTKSRKVYKSQQIRISFIRENDLF